MKKNITLVTLGALSVMGLAQVSVFADTTPVSYNSNANITFTENTDPNPINPVDPTDPSKPVDPTDPHQPGTAGPLSIDFASSLNFGSQKITTDDETYNASPLTYTTKDSSKTYGPNYVQVTDNTGSNNGWSLSVTEEKQLATSKGAELKGAAISFSNGEAITANGSDAKAPLAESGYTLVPGAASKVTTAQSNTGQGTWVTRYGKTAGADLDAITTSDSGTSIKLSVPGVSTKSAEAYTSTLKWELSQTPAANGNIN